MTYNAMWAALFNAPYFVGNKVDGFKTLFDNICSPNITHTMATNDVELGCSIFTVNFYGEADRTLSKYEYQVRLLQS